MYDYEDIKHLQGYTTSIINKSCAIKDLKLMRRNLLERNAVGAALIVGSSKFGIAEAEYSLVEELINASILHLECDITELNKKITDIQQKNL